MASSSGSKQLEIVVYYYVFWQTYKDNYFIYCRFSATINLFFVFYAFCTAENYIICWCPQNFTHSRHGNARTVVTGGNAVSSYHGPSLSCIPQLLSPVRRQPSRRRPVSETACQWGHRLSGGTACQQATRQSVTITLRHCVSLPVDGTYLSDCLSVCTHAATTLGCLLVRPFRSSSCKHSHINWIPCARNELMAKHTDLLAVTWNTTDTSYVHGQLLTTLCDKIS